MRAKKAAQSGFTLVELMVVMLIIAILAAILLPVLDKAKQKALTTECLNNYKQLQVCYLMYIQDNADKLPLNFASSMRLLLPEIVPSISPPAALL